MLCCKSSSKSAKRSSICFRLRWLRRPRFVVGKRAARLRFIVLLLGHGNCLRCIAELDAKCATRRCDAHVLVAEAADEIKRLLWRLLLRQSQRVRLDLRFDGGTDLWRSSEEAIRRHDVLDALMRTLEVIVLDEKLQAAQAVGEVGEDRLLQKVVPQRLPETLDLAERLRVLRTTRAVMDAVAT